MIVLMRNRTSIRPRCLQRRVLGRADWTMQSGALQLALPVARRPQHLSTRNIYQWVLLDLKKNVA